jgi:hypothetical protein
MNLLYFSRISESFNLYDQLGARRSAAQAINHRLLSFCKESKITANQRRVFNQRYKRWAPSGQYVVINPVKPDF